MHFRFKISRFSMHGIYNFICRFPSEAANYFFKYMNFLLVKGTKIFAFTGYTIFRFIAVFLLHY